jgi:ribosomal-protein-alanine N-acetyltransferase
MDENIVGYICGTSLFEEGELPKVAVKKECRGLGIGGKLVDRLLVEMREKGVEKIFLEVRVSNSSALKLYLGKGFEKLRERKRYYPDGEDALELVKSL